MGKQKIVYTDGCTVTGLTVDGVDLNDLSHEDKLTLLTKMINSADDSFIEEVIRDYTQMYGKYKHLYHCEECGDSVCEWKLSI